MTRVEFNEVLETLDPEALTDILVEIGLVNELPEDKPGLIRLLNDEYSDDAIGTLTREDVLDGFSI